MTREASVLQQPKNAGLLRAAFTALNPVWPGGHGFDVEFKKPVWAAAQGLELPVWAGAHDLDLVVEFKNRFGR